MKILLPVDGSENNKLALNEVANRKWEDGSEAKIIHIVDSQVQVTDIMGVNAEFTRDLHVSAVKKGDGILDAAKAIVGSGDLSVSSEILMAPPFHSTQQVIVDEAERYGADLIVMSSHGFSLWKRLTLGSVSLAVVQHAPCSVEIVRAKRLVNEQEN